MRELFVAAVLALPFALFALLTLWRRARFRRLAQELGGRWTSTALFAPGALEGPDFRLEVVRRGKGYGTRVSVAVRASPGVFLVRAAFLAEASGAAHVFVPGVRTERVFGAELRFGGLVPAEREQRQALLAWLPPAAELRRLHAALEEARIDELELDPTHLAASFRGIRSDATHLRRTLAALRGLAAGRTEEARRARAG